MGKYDVTIAQYCQFLNAVATTATPTGLYQLDMSTNFPTIGIARSGSPGSYAYSVTGPRLERRQYADSDVILGRRGAVLQLVTKRPADQRNRRGPGTTETGSYNLSGAITNAALAGRDSRSATAVYVLPTANEYYKAAYYNRVKSGTYWAYPTQSNTAPSNALSATGTEQCEL